MAFSISLTKATLTTTSTLFSKLLRSTHSRSLKTDVNIQSLIDTGRSLLAEVKETGNDKNISSELLEVFNWHPFLREGPKCPYETKVDGSNMYARIDTPGVGKEGVKMWMDKEDLCFEGDVVEKNPDNDDDVDALTPVLVGIPEHPFVIEGSDDLFVAKEDNEVYYLRVDLPGVEKEGVNLWIDNDFLYIEGVEANMDPYYDKESARKYQKRLSLPPGDCKTSEIKAQVKGGVLRVVLPKLKLEEKEGVLKLPVN